MPQMPSNNFKLDLLKFYAYMAFSNLLFFIPIDVLFFQERGLDLTQVFTIQAVFSLGIFLFEIPTGVIADRFGRKNSLLLGILAWIVADLIFFFGWGFGILAFAYLLWALGSCLNSGADTALLYDILHKNKSHGAFTKYQGTAKLVGLISVSLSAIIGSYIASFSLGWTFLGSAIGVMLCFPILNSIKHKEKSSEQTPSYSEILSITFKTLRDSKWLWWLISISLVFDVTIQLFRPLMQVYMEEAKLNISLFGVASAIYFMSGALATKSTHSFEKNTKKSRYWILSIALLTGVFLVQLFPIQWGFLYFGLLAFVCTINSILIEHELLKATPESSHASMLSFNSLLPKMFFIGLSPLFGYALQTQGLQTSVRIVGVVIAVIFTVLLVWNLLSKQLRHSI